MDIKFSTAVSVGKQKYPNILSKRVEYGTAGFRDKAKILPHIMYRMGLLAVLRSKKLHGAIIGVMVTASHNPEEDNGVKLCDPLGEMLNTEWEILATEIANATDEHVKELLEKLVKVENIDSSIPGNVFLARDTRSSSPHLSEAVVEGVKSLNGIVKDYGILTTPQLHFVVCCKNTLGTYGTETSEGYCKKLSSAFLRLQSEMSGLKTNYLPEVSVDAANGVGAIALKEISPYLNNILKINIFNDGKIGKLNHMCGADYVKVQQTIPEGAKIIPGQRYASLDGDADRLIYYYLDDAENFHMLDGDKIAVLISEFIKQLVELTGLKLQLHVVQTAYANGNSTSYIENVLKVPVICMPTGVKHLHHEAKKYDIGIYFEANGHGTVVFKEEAKTKIQQLSKDTSASDVRRKMSVKLLNTIDLINETVGDAISDLLLVEIILYDFGWSIIDWDQVYTDLPNRQLKVEVSDRTMISTTDAGRICVEPLGLQDSINSFTAKYKNARAFVRPSGTEDIIRVYAEADTQSNADLLANQIALKVQEFIGKKET